MVRERLAGHNLEPRGGWVADAAADFVAAPERFGGDTPADVSGGTK